MSAFGMRLTPSVVEALICQCFGIPGGKQRISYWHTVKGASCWGRLQLPHGAYHCHGEGRGLVRSISAHTHLECTSARRTEHWTIT